MPGDGPVAFVNVSDGVGVGIAIDGKLLRGAHNIAGEFGHVPLNLDGPRCSCGQSGCWEAYVSKRATVARYLGTDPSWPGVGRAAGRSPWSDIIARARDGREPGAGDAARDGRLPRPRPRHDREGHRPPARLPGRRDHRGLGPDRAHRPRGAARAGPHRRGGETEILTVPLGEHPRLRGAAALVSTPAFAAPIVA